MFEQQRLEMFLRIAGEERKCVFRLITKTKVEDCDKLALLWNVNFLVFFFFLI